MSEVKVALTTKVKTNDDGDLDSVPEVEGHWVSVVTHDGAKYRGTVEKVNRWSFVLDTYHPMSEGVYADKVVLRWENVKSVRGTL